MMRVATMIWLTFNFYQHMIYEDLQLLKKVFACFTSHTANANCVELIKQNGAYFSNINSGKIWSQQRKRCSNLQLWILMHYCCYKIDLGTVDVEYQRNSYYKMSLLNSTITFSNVLTSNKIIIWYIFMSNLEYKFHDLLFHRCRFLELVCCSCKSQHPLHDTRSNKSYLHFCTDNSCVLFP